MSRVNLTVRLSELRVSFASCRASPHFSGVYFAVFKYPVCELFDEHQSELSREVETKFESSNITWGVRCGLNSMSIEDMKQQGITLNVSADIRHIEGYAAMSARNIVVDKVRLGNIRGIFNTSSHISMFILPASVCMGTKEETSTYCNVDYTDIILADGNLLPDLDDVISFFRTSSVNMLPYAFDADVRVSGSGIIELSNIQLKGYCSLESCT